MGQVNDTIITQGMVAREVLNSQIYHDHGDPYHAALDDASGNTTISFQTFNQLIAAMVIIGAGTGLVFVSVDARLINGPYLSRSLVWSRILISSSATSRAPWLLLAQFLPTTRHAKSILIAQRKTYCCN